MLQTSLAQQIEGVRRFNRFYTREIGVLHEGFLDSPFTLTEGRVLYELAHREKPTATAVRTSLRLDAGYLSRILAAFEKRGLIQRVPSRNDGRQSLLALTGRGRRQFAPLEARSSHQVGSLIARLPEAKRRELIGAMQTIEKLLGPEEAQESSTKAPYLLRPPHAGDMGWVVHRQGILYAEEYGYDEHFEALAAEVVAHFVQHYNPKRERCWIAERDGQVVGSVFLVARSKTVSQLRLLYVEPAARGLGIGSRLVEECVRFARQVGDKKMILWTQSELDAARHIYRQAGFRITARKAHHSFNRDLVAETWERSL